MKRRHTVLLAIVFAGAAFVSSTQDWLNITGMTAFTGTEMSISGQQATPVVSAMALVGLAGAIALSLVGRIGRIVISAVLTVIGLLIAWASLIVVFNPEQHAQPHIAEQTGLTGVTAETTVHFFAYLAVVSGVGLAAMGAVALFLGNRWSADAARKYENTTVTPGAQAEITAPAEPQDLPKSDVLKITQNSSAGTEAQQGNSEAEESPLDEIDAWDDLTHGKDPT